MTSDLQILSEFSVMVSNGLELVDWFQEVQWLFLESFQWVGQICYPNFEGVHHHPIFFAFRWLYLGVYPISRPGHPNRNPNLLLDGVESHSNGWWVYLRRCTAERWAQRLQEIPLPQVGASSSISFYDYFVVFYCIYRSTAVHVCIVMCSDMIWWWYWYWYWYDMIWWWWWWWCNCDDMSCVGMSCMPGHGHPWTPNCWLDHSAGLLGPESGPESGPLGPRQLKGKLTLIQEGQIFPIGLGCELPYLPHLPLPSAS